MVNPHKHSRSLVVVSVAYLPFPLPTGAWLSGIHPRPSGFWPPTGPQGLPDCQGAGWSLTLVLKLCSLWVKEPFLPSKHLPLVLSETWGCLVSHLPAMTFVITLLPLSLRRCFQEFPRSLFCPLLFTVTTVCNQMSHRSDS